MSPTTPTTARPNPNDRYLMELQSSSNVKFDPALGLGNMYTERARNAQAAKWERMFKKWGPTDELPRSLLPSKLAKNGKTVALMNYGYPYTREWALEYAKRHRLGFEIGPECTERWARGETSFDYGDMTEEDLKDEDFKWLVYRQVHEIICRHISGRVGAPLDICRPFSGKYRFMLALYSTQNAEERMVVIQRRWGPRRVMEKFQEAMTEGDEDAKPQWWYDWDNRFLNINTARV